MKAAFIVLAIFGAWSASAMSAPYQIIEEGAVVVAHPYPGMWVSRWELYKPYALTCEHTDQVVVVPSGASAPPSDVTSSVPSTGNATITVHRC